MDTRMYYCLLLLVYILIQIPAVQDYAREKIIVYLENKIKTKVEIEKAFHHLSQSALYLKTFFEDQQKIRCFMERSLELMLPYLNY